MGKNSRRQLEAYDATHGVALSVDSQEEIDALNFCDELVRLSVLEDFSYQPCSFVLFEGADYVDQAGKTRCLFRDHVYSPDFCLLFDPAKSPELAKEFRIGRNQLSAGTLSVYIDVKGTFAGHDGGRSFSLNQKWTWQKTGIYVYKLVPKVFFKKFGVPLASFYSSKTKKRRKMFAGYRSMRETLFPDRQANSK